MCVRKCQKSKLDLDQVYADDSNQKNQPDVISIWEDRIRVLTSIKLYLQLNSATGRLLGLQLRLPQTDCGRLDWRAIVDTPIEMVARAGPIN